MVEIEADELDDNGFVIDVGEVHRVLDVISGRSSLSGEQLAEQIAHALWEPHHTSVKVTIESTGSSKISYTKEVPRKSSQPKEEAAADLVEEIITAAKRR